MTEVSVSDIVCQASAMTGDRAGGEPHPVLEPEEQGVQDDRQDPFEVAETRLGHAYNISHFGRAVITKLRFRHDLGGARAIRCDYTGMLAVLFVSAMSGAI